MMRRYDGDIPIILEGVCSPVNTSEANDWLRIQYSGCDECGQPVTVSQRFTQIFEILSHNTGRVE